MLNKNKWATAIICTLIAVICLLGTLLLLKNNPSESTDGKGSNAKRAANEKPLLPIEARFVSKEGKNYLKISPRPGVDLPGELAVEITKWKGAGSKFESSTTRLIKKDSVGIYLETPPNPRVAPDYYAYRIHLPQLYYNIGIYGGNSWREYSTYLPGDTVQILNSLCEPIVIVCPLKVTEQSNIAPDTKGSIDFIRK